MRHAGRGLHHEENLVWRIQQKLHPINLMDGRTWQKCCKESKEGIRRVMGSPSAEKVPGSSNQFFQQVVLYTSTAASSEPRRFSKVRTILSLSFRVASRDDLESSRSKFVSVYQNQPFFGRIIRICEWNHGGVMTINMYLYMYSWIHDSILCP